MTDEDLIRGHAWQSDTPGDVQCDWFDDGGDRCMAYPSQHADPGRSTDQHPIYTHPHVYQNNNPTDTGYCTYTVYDQRFSGSPFADLHTRTCGYPRDMHERVHRALPVRVADVAQYRREPMPDSARGKISVTLIDAPVDPLGTLAVICGIYKGEIRRSKSEVTDEQRRQVWADMQKTVLSGPLEAMQLTFLIEGVDRALTHQIVRNRFSFFAQESLRFATAEDWAAEVALPPSLLGRKEDDPLVSLWRKGLNTAEDLYSALIAAGMPTEEARGLLPHAIPTRLFWTMSIRTLLMEAGKRTCTQAQFPWRLLMAGIAKALRARATEGEFVNQIDGVPAFEPFLDNWQYELFASAIQPVCYQTGRCGFKADFDRACSIRDRVDQNERVGRPSEMWHWPGTGADGEEILPIDPREWMADPAAARVVGDAS